MKRLLLTLGVWGALSTWALAGPATTQSGAQAIDRVLAEMAQAKRRFDPGPLRAGGAVALERLMDRLLPDTRTPAGGRPDPKALNNLIAALNADSFEERAAAATRLTEWGLPVWKQLRAIAEDPDEPRERAHRANAVLTGLASGQWANVGRYVEAFRVYARDLKDPECLKVLARRAEMALECGMPDMGREDVLYLCLRAVAREGDPATLAILDPLIDHDEEAVAVFVLQTVGGFRGPKPLPAFFRRAAQSKRDAVAAAAMEWMPPGEIAVRPGKPPEGTGKAQMSRAYAQLQRGDEAAIRFLLDAAADYESEHCREAAGWLCSHANGGRRELVPRLLPLLESPEPFVRASVGRTAVCFGDEAALRAALQLLVDPNEAVALNVAREFANRCESPAVQRLIADAARNDNADLRAVARVLQDNMQKRLSTTRPSPATKPSAATKPSPATKRLSVPQNVPLPTLPSPRRPWWQTSPAQFARSMFVQGPLTPRQQAMFDPTLIDLDVRNVPAREVFDRIARQAGIRFEPVAEPYWDRRTQTVTLEARRQPFWSVMLSVIEQSRVPIRLHDRATIHLVGGNLEMSGRPLVCGPLLVYQRFLTDWTQPYDPPGMQRLHFEINAFNEPKLNIVGLAPVEIDEAVDEAGRSLLGDRESPERGGGLDGGLFASAGNTYWRLETNLWRKVGADGSLQGTRLARIRGRLRVVVALQTHSLDIPDLQAAEGKAYPLGPARIVMQGLSQQGGLPQARGGNYQLDFSVAPRKRPPEEWVSTARFLASFRYHLYDEEGYELETEGRRWPPLTIPGKQYILTSGDLRNPPLKGKPTRLRIESPAQVRAIEIPFEFKDIDLPAARELKRRPALRPIPR